MDIAPHRHVNRLDLALLVGWASRVGNPDLAAAARAWATWSFLHGTRPPIAVLADAAGVDLDTAEQLASILAGMLTSETSLRG
jgi:hypothetical protein